MKESKRKNRTRLIALLLVLVETLSLLANAAYALPDAGALATDTTLVAEVPSEPADTAGDTAEEASPAAEDQETPAEEADGEETPAEEPDPEEGEAQPRAVAASLTAEDGTCYTVTVSYDESAGLPDDVRVRLRQPVIAPEGEAARLAAEQGRPYDTERFVTAGELADYRRALRDTLAVGDKDFVFFSGLLDVELVSGELVVQPQAPVEITVETDGAAQSAGYALESAMLWPAETYDEQGQPLTVIRGQALDTEDVGGEIAPTYDENGLPAEGNARLLISTDSLTTLGLLGVADEKAVWQVQGVTLTLYGSRSTVWAVSNAVPRGLTDGVEALTAFYARQVRSDTESEAEYAVAPMLWLAAAADGETPRIWGQGAGLSGLLTDGYGRNTAVFGREGTAEPVMFHAGDVISVLWDTGLRTAALESGAVTVTGLLPTDAVLTAADVTADYQNAEALTGIAGGFARTLAAYDISIQAEGETYLPGEARPVSVAVANDAIAQGKAITVWHVTADGTAAEVACTVFDGTVSFAATEGGVYVVVNSSRELTVTASDGNTYEIAVTYGPDAAIPTDAQLSVRELSGAEYTAYYYRTQAKVGADSFNTLRAFDISFVLPDGTEVEPRAAVSVSIRILNRFTALENTRVVHFGDEVEVIAPETSDNGTTLDFTAGSFSVYVVIGHEGDGEVETPRVEFHFIGQDYTESGTTYTADPFSFVNKAGTYQTTQILKDGEALEMIANPPNVVEDNSEKYFYGWYVVEKTSVADNGKISYQWTVDPEQISMETSISITDTAGNAFTDENKAQVGGKVKWTIGTVSGKAELDRNGTAHVYLAPVYEDYRFINFHLGTRDDSQLRATLYARRLVVLGSDERVTLRIGNIKAPSTDPSKKVFSGWETVDADFNSAELFTTINNEGNEIDSNGAVGLYFATFTKAGFTGNELDLYPVFDEARWIDFNTGLNGNGALYVPSQFRITHDLGKGNYYDTLPTSTRVGYAFDGWYADAVLDSDGNITNLPEDGVDNSKSVEVHYVDGSGQVQTKTETRTAFQVTDGDGNVVAGDHKNSITVDETTYDLFKIIGGKLYLYKGLDRLTLYAKWDVIEDTTVQVNVWRQKVTDDKNAADKDKDYDYVKDYSYSVQASSNQTLQWLRDNNKLHVGGTATGADVETLVEKGFTYRTTEMSTDKVASNGSTVVNVYYDRDLITFNFYTYGTKEYAETTADTPTTQYALIDGKYEELTRDNGTQATVWRPQYTYTSTTADGTDLYGLVDGEYVKLTRNSQQVVSYKWQYTDNWGTYDFPSNWTNNIFYLSDHSESGYTSDNPPSNDDNTTYYCYDSSSGWRQLKRVANGTTTTYAYTYGSGTEYSDQRYSRAAGGDAYGGTRYTKDGAKYTVTTGEDGTQFGVDRNGGHVQLNKGTETVYKWYAPVYKDVYHSTAATTGELYGQVGEKYYALTPVTTETITYQYTTTLTAGKEYLIVSRRSVGTGYALGHSGTSIVSDAVTVNAGSPQYINADVVDDTSVWMTAASGSNYTFSNGGSYLRYASSGLFNLHAGTDTEYREWGWNRVNCQLSARSKNASHNTMYLIHSDGFILNTSNDSVYLYQKVTTPTLDYYTYVDDNGDTQTYALSEPRFTKTSEKTDQLVEYTGVRWEKKTVSNGWHLYKRYTGLYGQTLEQNGYVWDTKFDWNSVGNTNGTTSGTHTTFLDAFLPTENTTTIPFYGGSTTTGRNVIFYKQDLNADGTAANTYTEANRVGTSGNGTFSISDKYNGFTAYQYRVDGGEWKSTGTTKDSNGYYVTGVSYSSTLEIRFNRDLSSLTFVTQYPGNADLWDGSDYTPTDADNSKTVENIPYGASLVSYGSGGANSWTPHNPPHYTFGGWFKDKAGTQEFEFDKETMPNGDVIVYAKWSPVEFRVEIDPNGGEIDHIDHDKYYYEVTYTTPETAPGYSDSVVSVNGSTTTVNIPTFTRAGDTGYRKDQSTYFNADYNEAVGRYELSRGYVPISDAAADIYVGKGGTVYYYMNMQYQSTDGRSIPADLRNALFLTADQVDEYYNFYHDYLTAMKTQNPSKYASTVVLGKAAWKSLYVSNQKYRPTNTAGSGEQQAEHYEMLGWYRVRLDAEGNEISVDPMPYNFSDPVKEPMRLRAYWRLDAGYRVEYVPQYTMEDGTVINGDMEQWEDPSANGANYAEGAKTQILQQPTGLTANGEATSAYIFRGWQVVSISKDAQNKDVYVPLNEGVCYQPGDDYIIDAADAGSDNKILIQAYYELKNASYRRPEVTNLTLNANGGFITNDGKNELQEDINLTWDGVGTVAVDHVADTIAFGDIQSNAAVHLYRYATTLTEDAGGNALDPVGKNYFLHKDKHFLLGFNEEAVDHGYLATHPADSIVAVTRNDNRTLYAVWEPMVYLNFVNRTSKTITFKISSTEGALTIVNAKDGLYGRTAMTTAQLDAIEIAAGETLMYAVPNGAEKSVTVTVKNELGIGKILTWDTALTVGDATYNTANETDPVTYLHAEGDEHVLAEGRVNNTLTDSFNEKLINNPDGITVTFGDADSDYALVLEDNWNGDGTGGSYQEFDYSETQIVANPHPSKTLPTTSTRSGGWQFLGWAYEAAATEADFSATKPDGNPWTIADLQDFFFTNPSVNKHEITTNQGTDEVHTLHIARLYAVWKINKDASTVYVYNDVPAPGNQKAPFTFTLDLYGVYQYKSGGTTHESKLSGNYSFELCHGDYAVLENANSAPEGYIQTKVTVYKADGTVKVAEQTYKVQAEAGKYGEGGSFNNTERITVTTETEGQKNHYTTSVSRTAQTDTHFIYVGDSTDTTTVPLTENTNTIHCNTFAGGTVVFTNERETYDVTVRKTLLGGFGTQDAFRFTATYVDDAGTDYKTETQLEDFYLSGGGSTVLEKIPAGASLTITEQGEDLHNYITTARTGGASAHALGVTATADTSGSEAVYFRAVTINVSATEKDVTFINQVKSCKVTFKLVDQDKNPGVEAFFKLTAPAGTVGNQLYPDENTGVFYSQQEFFVGDYTMTQTFVDTDSNYLGLAEPVAITVTGSADDGNASLAITPAAADTYMVGVTGDAAEGFVVTVYNIKTASIKIAKVLNDPLLPGNRAFYFNVSYDYRYPLATEDTTVNMSGDNALSVTSGSTKAVRVPVGATGLTITEDTDRQVTNDNEQTIAETYEVSYRVTDGNGDEKVAAAAGSSYNHGTVGLTDHNDTVTFTNERKTVNINISTIEIGGDHTGEFTFEVKILNGAIPIAGYTVYDKGTPGVTSDDWVTDATGLVKRPGDLLLNLIDGAEPATVKLPVGATVTVEEKLTDAQNAKGYAVFMTMPGVKLTLVNGRADKVRLIGPTEDKDIYVYNIPSICKVTDNAGDLLYVLQQGGNTPNDPTDDIYIPAICATIKEAFMGRGGIGGLGNYYQKDSTEKYTATSQHRIEMLTDYDVPTDDVVTVNAGHDMVFTTAAQDATDGYPFRRTGQYQGNGFTAEQLALSEGRAVLRRAVDPDNLQDAFFTVNGANNKDTVFTMSKLIIDGSGAYLKDGVQGGCLTATKSDVTIENCVICRFGASQGGAVYTTGESLTVKNAVFDTCISKLAGNGNGGGGIHTTATTFSAKDSHFIGCKAAFQGGGAAFTNNAAGSSVTISGCTFNNCTATNGGGIYSAVQTMTIQDNGSTHTTISGCTATNGGGVNANGTALGLAGNTTVTNCTATNGGGVYLTNATLTINSDNTTITRCSARTGGGVFVGKSGSAELSKGAIRNNKAAFAGSAAQLESGGAFTVSGGEVSNNETNSENNLYGGAFGVQQGTLTISGGEVKNNSAVSTENDAKGGAIYFESGSVTISGGSITGNYAKAEMNNKLACGGAVFVAGANTNLTITGGTISGNWVENTKASDTAKGAGIYLADGSTLNISGSPNFGDGNYVVQNYSGKKNGGEDYGKLEGAANPQPRQDIWIPAKNGQIECIRVTGALNSAEASIWVWADTSTEKDNRHYEEEQQFAVANTGVTGNFAAFRDAQDDITTSGAVRSDFLRGAPGQTAGTVVWGTGQQRKVILKKVMSGTHQPLSGAAFEIWKAGAGEAMTWTATNLGISGSDGVFFVGNLSDGTYYLHETQAPAGTLTTSGGWWYTLTVNSNGAVVKDRRTTKDPTA